MIRQLWDGLHAPGRLLGPDKKMADAEQEIREACAVIAQHLGAILTPDQRIQLAEYFRTMARRNITTYDVHKCALAAKAAFVTPSPERTP